MASEDDHRDACRIQAFDRAAYGSPVYVRIATVLANGLTRQSGRCARLAGQRLTGVGTAQAHGRWIAAGLPRGSDADAPP
ncbi:MAG: hypothetical protein EOP68_20005 [Sphingomonas sp.]|nr:MAG: hypothetical protein EOP68_20005 [Sphingomonas sp.]